MKTAVKPQGGCRTGFAFFDADGNLRQYSWGELKQRGEALWTRHDGKWRRLRNNRDLRRLGDGACIAPLDASTDLLEQSAVSSPSVIDQRAIRRLSSIRDLVDADRAVLLLSNRYAMLSHEQRMVLSIARDSSYQIPSGMTLTENQAAVVDALRSDPSDRNIALALAELEKGDSSEQWRVALSSFMTQRGFSTEGGGLLDDPIGGRIMQRLFKLDPATAPDVIALADALSWTDRYAPSDIADVFEEAGSLVQRFGSREAALCYLARVPEGTDPELAARVISLQRAGGIASQEALEVLKLAPNAHDLLRAELFNSGSLTPQMAREIEAAWSADKLQATLRYGDGHLLAELVLSNHSFDPADIQAVVTALGHGPADRCAPALLTALQAVPQDALVRALSYTKVENNSAIPNADLALRLALAFGDDLESYLTRTVSPSDARRVATRQLAVAPALTESILLARDPSRGLPDDPALRRAHRKAVGDAQVNSRANLEKRLSMLESSFSGIEEGTLRLEGKLQAASAIEDPIAREREVRALQAELASRPALLEAKRAEHRALGALMAAYDTATDDEITGLVGEWVASTFSTPAPTVGLSLHDASFWLPADPEHARSFGEWFQRGDRSVNALKRATGIADLTLISRAWPKLDDEQRTASFGKMLEHARDVAGTKGLGDRFTAALERTGATKASAQTTLDWVRDSFDKPSPFPLERVFEASGAGGTVSGRFIPRDDVRGPQLGILSNCCQHPDGAGAPCARAGQTHPAMGFFVVEDNAGNVIAQSWVWADGTGGVCFDNVEGRVGDKEALTLDVYQSATDALLERFHTVSVGRHNSVQFRAQPMDTPLQPSTVGYHGYRDSSSQLLLAQRSADYGLVTVGTEDGFIWKEGDSSVTVRGSTLTFDGPQAAAIADRMLPSMGARTWNVTTPSGSHELRVEQNPHLTPNIDGMPSSVFAVSEETRERINTFAPHLSDEEAHGWFTTAGQDLDMMRNAITNGWDPHQVRAVMRNKRAAPLALASTPPDELVLSAISAGYSIERANAHFAPGSEPRELLEHLRQTNPRASEGDRLAVIASALQTSTPKAAAEALLGVDSPSTRAAVIDMAEAGVALSDIRTIVQSGVHHQHLGTLTDAARIDAVRQLTPEQAHTLAFYSNDKYQDADTLLALATLDEETRSEVYRADPGLQSREVVSFITSGGSASDWSAVNHATWNAPGEQLASFTAADIQQLNDALERAGVRHAMGENVARYQYNGLTLTALSDSTRVAKAVEAAERMLEHTDTSSYGSNPESPISFAAFATAEIEPDHAAAIAAAGITPYAVMRSCQDSGFTRAHAAELATFINDVPEERRSALMDRPHAIPIAKAVFSASDPDPRDAALLQMMEKASTQGDTKGIIIDEVVKLWEQPASRSRLRDLVASSRSLRDLLIQASDPAKFKRHGGKVQRERPVIHPDF
jgi:hypothetical protein